MYIRCTDCLDLQKNLNIKNCMNSTKICVQWMYGLSGFVENLNSEDTLNVQNCVN